MIISKYEKSYDTSDGSEQPFGHAEDSVRPAEEVEVADARWEDDGGGPPILPRTPIFVQKPAWSILSLADVNAAMRRECDPCGAERTREKSRREEVSRVDSVARADHEAEMAVRTERERYRNAWEHT